jgi:hypothetical protein
VSDPRKELLSQIARLRGSLDPEVVRRLELAKEGKVPVDRQAAEEVVRRFLADRRDGGRLRALLTEKLRRP